MNMARMLNLRILYVPTFTTVDLQHFRMALHKSPDWSRAYVDNLGAFGKTEYTLRSHYKDT
jgi:hypothetical protein